MIAPANTSITKATNLTTSSQGKPQQFRGLGCNHRIELTEARGLSKGREVRPYNNLMILPLAHHIHHAQLGKG